MFRAVVLVVAAGALVLASEPSSTPRERSTAMDFGLLTLLRSTTSSALPPPLASL
jgi:hypothetical protein